MFQVIIAIIALPILIHGIIIKSQVQYELDSSSEVNNMYLTSFHEVIGIDYAFLSAEGKNFTFDNSSNSLYIETPLPTDISYKQSLSIDSTAGDDNIQGNVQFSIAGAEYVSVDENNLIRIRNSNAFFACKDIPELGGNTYSADNWAVLFYPYGHAPATCVYIKLIVESDNDDTNTDANENTESNSLEASSSLISVVVSQSSDISDNTNTEITTSVESSLLIDTAHSTTLSTNSRNSGGTLSINPVSLLVLVSYLY